MGGEARKCKLREVADINPESLSPNWPYDHIRYLDISSVGEGAVMAPPKLMLLSDAPSRAKRLVKAGDTVLSTVRPGRRSIFFVKETIPDLVVSTGFAVVRPRTDKVDPYFLYACVFDRSFTAYLVSREKGAAYPAVLPNDIAEAEIFLPPLPEQRAIARILGTFDDKIELNRRMNETLEAMAQALFKSWFVDFDPVVVNALKAGNPIPDKFADRAAHYRENPDRLGLPEEILRLFPDRFVDSELGPIPEGWRATTIGDEFNLMMGQSPPSSTYNEEGQGLPFFQGCRDFGSRYPLSRVYCTAPTRIAHAGDTLISVRAPVGDINMAFETCCIGRGIAAIRHQSGSRSFTYYTILVLRERLKSYEAGGTVFGAISKKQLKNIPIISPDIKPISVFEDIACPMDESIRSFEDKSRTLSALRDTLLPKLISGELRVPDVEKILEDAL